MGITLDQKMDTIGEILASDIAGFKFLKEDYKMLERKIMFETMEESKYEVESFVRKFWKAFTKETSATLNTHISTMKESIGNMSDNEIMKNQIIKNGEKLMSRYNKLVDANERGEFDTVKWCKLQLNAKKFNKFVEQEYEGNCTKIEKDYEKNNDERKKLLTAANKLTRDLEINDDSKYMQDLAELGKLYSTYEFAYEPYASWRLNKEDNRFLHKAKSILPIAIDALGESIDPEDELIA